jgi:hypothetical protein
MSHWAQKIFQYLLLGLKTMANKSSNGNQSWGSFKTHSSTSLSQFCCMQWCMLYFHELTASSVKILVKEIVRPSRKKRWHASDLTSMPARKNQFTASKQGRETNLFCIGQSKLKVNILTLALAALELPSED